MRDDVKNNPVSKEDVVPNEQLDKVTGGTMNVTTGSSKKEMDPFHGLGRPDQGGGLGGVN